MLLNGESAIIKISLKILLAKDFKCYTILIMNKHFISNVDLKASKNLHDKYVKINFIM